MMVTLNNKTRYMALTPYIWALWQTKTGRVIIICVLVYLIGGAIIMTLKWWTIAIVAGLALMFLFIKKETEKERKREYERQRKELEDEFNRIHEIGERMQRNKHNLHNQNLN